MFRIILLIMLLPTLANGATYWLDAVDGNDTTGTGTELAPWQTLAKAQSIATSGDVFNLEAGSYGGYIETSVTRTDWVTYQAVDGAVPHLTNISVKHSGEPNIDAYLRFDGIRILPDVVAQTEDPQDPNSDQDTYNKSAIPVATNYINYFQVLNTEMGGYNHWLTEAIVYSTYCDDVLYENIYAHTAVHAFRFISRHRRATVRGSSITDLTGTGINMVGTRYEDMLYEYNYIFDTCIYPYTEDYAPKADGEDIHGSGISIRDGHTTVRGNIIHNAASTAGISMYEDDAGNDYVNMNVLIENNLVYDIFAYYPVTMYEVGPNVVVRNNIFVGRHYATTGDLMYRSAFAMYAVDTSEGTPSLELYNNIMVGKVSIYTGTVGYETEEGNIMWSYSLAGDEQCNGDPGLSANSTTYCCGASCPPNQTAGDAIWDEMFPYGDLDFSYAHGKVIDWRLGPDSDSLNYGIVAHQPSESLGSIVNGFIVQNGVSRDASRHSAGAYEYGTESVIGEIFSISGQIIMGVQ